MSPSSQNAFGHSGTVGAVFAEASSGHWPQQAQSYVAPTESPTTTTHAPASSNGNPFSMWSVSNPAGNQAAGKNNIYIRRTLPKGASGGILSDTEVLDYAGNYPKGDVFLKYRDGPKKQWKLLYSSSGAPEALQIKPARGKGSIQFHLNREFAGISAGSQAQADNLVRQIQSWTFP